MCVFVSHYYPIRWPSNKSHRHMETLTKRTISAKLDSKLVFRIYRRCQRDINLFFFGGRGYLQKVGLLLMLNLMPQKIILQDRNRNYSQLDINYPLVN